MTSVGTQTTTAFSTALGRHYQAVWAIMLRDFRARYGARRLGLFWAFFGPAMYVAIFSIIMATVRGRTTPLGSEVPPFLAMGVMNYMLYDSVQSFVRKAIKSNRNLLSFPRVKPIDVYIGGFITELATLIVVFVAMFWLFILLGWIGLPDEPHRLLPPMALSATLGFSMGLIGAALGSLTSLWDTIYRFSRRLIFFTSGIFFIASGLPTQIRIALEWQPLLHNAEWIRSAYYDTFESHFLDVEYTAIFTMIALFTGLVVERVTRNRVINEL